MSSDSARIEDVIYDADMVLLMSVNPGFAAQKFIPQTFEKIKKLNDLIHKNQLNTLIEVDGGVDDSNAERLFEAGANVLVAGNSIFSSSDPKAMISRLKNFK